MKTDHKKQKCDLIDRICSYLSNGYPLLLMIAFLLIPFNYYSVVRLRYVLFLALCGGFIVLMGVLKAGTALVDRRRLQQKRLSAIDAAILCYILLTSISAAAAPFTGTFLGNTRNDGLLTVAIYGLSTLLLMRLLCPKRWMVIALVAALCLNCLLILLQVYGLNPLELYPEGMNFYGINGNYVCLFIGVIGNADLVSAFFALGLGVLVTAITRGKQRRNLWLLLPTCLSSFVLYAIGTDEGVFAVLVGMVLVLPLSVHTGTMLYRAFWADSVAALGMALATIIRFHDHIMRLRFTMKSVLLLSAAVLLGLVGVLCFRYFRNRVRHLRRCLCIFVVLTVICSAAFLFVYDSGSGPLREAHEMLHGNFDDTFGSGRIYIWRQTLEKIWERPLLGSGPDTLEQHGLWAFPRYVEELGKEIPMHVDVAHNEYLNIAANQGIPALMAYLTIFLLTLIRWWKHPNDDVTAICGSGILFYAIAAFFGISMFLTAPFLWLLIAGANRVQNVDKRRQRA